MKKYLLLFILLAVVTARSQRMPAVNDALLLQPYSKLDEKIEEFGKDARAIPFLDAYLQKAKKERNYGEILNGYKNYLHASPNNLRLTYADSMIGVAERSKDNNLLGSAYLTKGIVYFSQKRHSKALDHYLIANKYLAKSNDAYLKNKVKYNIASIKYYLGYYSDAINLYKECIAYFKDENTLAYLSCLHSLGLCYNRMGDYVLCSATNEYALQESARLEVPDMDALFKLSQGINLYFLRDYSKAIVKIKNTLAAICNEHDFANESVAYFYLGKNYLALGKEDTAMNYFRKVDQLFKSKGYLRPDLREGYELLIKNSRAQNNIRGELYYVNQLLKADSLLHSDYIDLSKKIYRDYDTALLLKAKDSLEGQLSERKTHEYFFIFIVAVLFTSLLYLAYRYFKIRHHYKIRFEALFDQAPSGAEEQEPLPLKEELATLIIKPEVVEYILNGLVKFESQHKYLQSDLTVGKLADSIGTNPKYLSKVIAAYRGKKFVYYINDLKIDYIIELVKTEGKYRNYTNKALAEEAGFSTTQHFTTAFSKYAGISPTFFITELKKRYAQEIVPMDQA
ncbi:helix-turn-helix domain-containing protein [Flavobacterium psychrotrophum]|uniref:helix-turn-helix domain-containing protein n=1 Tax=Flavobacterium psychrotrophum TaxID=2294119 RepID=UPI0013C4E895|nr:helix-turn-helix domain-containing protein [Flavobacterium psychrotrophum]